MPSATVECSFSVENVHPSRETRADVQLFIGYSRTVFVLHRRGGRLLSVPQERVQRGEHRVLVGLRRIQNHRFEDKDALQSQIHLHGFL